MADWDGLRGDLEGAVAPPPLSALRERRRRRKQRRVVTTSFALVLVASASGLALLGGAERGGSQVTASAALSRVVSSDKLPPPEDYESYVVTDVDFVTRDTGWALGLRCVGSTCDVATWRSDDGGRSWGAAVPVARGVPRVTYHEEDPSGGAVRSLRMVDDKNGYAFNPDLYVTSDGARTWTRVAQPSKVTSVTARGATVWVVERGCAAAVDCDLVVRTGPVGGALTDLAVPETNGAAAIVRRGADDEAYLLAWDAPDASHASLFRTGDAGRTWTSGTNPCPDADAASLNSGAGRPLWLVCTSGTTRRAFQSLDHGTSWRRLGDPPSEGVVTDLVARDANEAYLATQTPGRLHVTTDGGATWRPAEGAGKGYGFANVDVDDTGAAWAMGDAGVLWRARDGVRWERLALPPGGARATASPSPTPVATTSPPAPPPADPGVTFTDLSFLDAARGWALGYDCTTDDERCDAVLRRTRDGGTTWEYVNIPGKSWSGTDLASPGGRVSGVTFADDENGWLFGPNLFVTHDGGRTWTDLEEQHVTDAEATGAVVWVVTHEGCAGTPCYPSLLRGAVGENDLDPLDGYRVGRLPGDFTALDERHAFFVDNYDGADGRDPVLVGTADGGETWTSHPAPCDHDIRTLSAYSATGLWALCAGGTDDKARRRLALSEDGGATWRTSDLPGTGRALGQVVAFSATRAWRSGPNAGLLVTTDGGETWTAARGVLRQVVDLTFADNTHGWALDAEGYVRRTTDGSTWQRLGRP